MLQDVFIQNSIGISAEQGAQKSPLRHQGDITGKQLVI